MHDAKYINQKLFLYYEKVEIRSKGIGAVYRSFVCYVIAAMLKDGNKRFLISIYKRVS